MSISLEKKRVYSEVLEFIYLLDKKYIDKIPTNLIKYLEEEKDKEYFKNINPWEDLEKQGLKKDTIALLSIINLNYWSNTDNRKKLQKIYADNEEYFQKESRIKYSPDNIFKKDVFKVSPTNLPTIKKEYKENFITKIISKIKEILSKRQ